MRFERRWYPPTPPETAWKPPDPPLRSADGYITFTPNALGKADGTWTALVEGHTAGGEKVAIWHSPHTTEHDALVVAHALAELWAAGDITTGHLIDDGRRAA